MHDNDRTCSPVNALGRRARIGGIAIGLVVGATLAACGGGSGGTEARSASTSRGSVLYQANCASCHGVDLQGTDKGPSHLSVVYAPGHHPDDSFRSAVANGAPAHHWTFGDMPPIAGLDASEVDSIIAFVRQVQEEEGLR